MELEVVRTFVAVADGGRFQDAAAALSLTQQAVSKRVAALERELGVRLLARTPRGATLTVDGQAFLPHARELLRAGERATASVRPGARPLRVDVIGRRAGPATLLREFHHAHPAVALDVVTLLDPGAGVAALADGTIDATFRAVLGPLPAGMAAVRVLDEPLDLLVGPSHPLAAAASITPPELAGHRIWIPGIAPGTEWGAYYDALAATFGLSIDAIGPNFGTEALFDALADSAELATLFGTHTRALWPADHDLRRVPVREPTPVYPHALVWRRDNPHPGLAALRDHLGEAVAAQGTWTP